MDFLGKSWVFLLLILFSVQTSFAQNLKDTIYQIPTVSVSSEMLFKKHSAGMQVVKIDSATIQENIGNDLGGMLSENSQVFIKSNGRGAFSTASFRGTSSNHTQVTWNGMPLNSPLIGMVDFSMLPLFVFDEVSVLHGGASLINSSGGLGGGIELNQSFSADTALKVIYNQGYGSYSTHHELLSVSLPMKKWHFETKIFNLSSQNDYTFINRAIGHLNEKTGFIEHPLDTNKRADYQFKGVLQEIYYLPNSNNKIALFYWGQMNERAIPRVSSYEGPDNQNLNRQYLGDHKLQLQCVTYASKHKFKTSIGGIYQNSHYQKENHVSGLGNVPIIAAFNTQKSAINTFEYQYNGWEKWDLTIKTNINYHTLNGNDTVIHNTFNHERFELLPVASIQYQSEKWNAQFLVRQEYIDKQWMPFVPYAGADYQPLKKYPFKISLNGGRNFRWPSINDLHWSPGGNPNLLPEYGWNGATGVTYLHSKKHNSLKLDVHYFYNYINNWILWTPSFKGYWEPINLSKVISNGIEASLKFQRKFGAWSINSNINYAYTKATNFDESIPGAYGKQLVYIPEHSGNLNIRLQYKNAYLRYQHNSYSERFTTTSNDFNRRDWLYPYFMNNVALGGKWKTKKLIIQSELAINNVLNETYHSVLYRPMPKMNYLMSLQFKYQR